MEEAKKAAPRNANWQAAFDDFHAARRRWRAERGMPPEELPNATAERLPVRRGFD